MLINRALRVMAVSSRKGVGYGQLFEPEQTTVQTLVHPPVTVPLGGEPTPLFLQQFAFYFPWCCLISLFQLLHSGNCFNYLLFHKERHFPLVERGAASDCINADKPLSMGESSTALPALAAQVERRLASAHSYCWQIGLLTTVLMAICTGLPGMY